LAASFFARALADLLFCGVGALFELLKSIDPTVEDKPIQEVMLILHSKWITKPDHLKNVTANDLISYGLPKNLVALLKPSDGIMLSISSHLIEISLFY
jgi:ATP-dependent protease Clp ATPase subunit